MLVFVDAHTPLPYQKKTGRKKRGENPTYIRIYSRIQRQIQGK